MCFPVKSINNLCCGAIVGFKYVYFVTLFLRIVNYLLQVGWSWFYEVFLGFYLWVIFYLKADLDFSLFIKRVFVEW